MWCAVGVAGLACLARLLTPGGAIAAAVVGAVVWERGGPAYAVPLVVFFVTGSLMGRLPGAKNKEGPRTAMQVIANGGVATVATLIPNGETAFVAALCAANADTWATEIGTRLGGRPFRITKFKSVEIGVSGAVSGAGLLGSAAGAIVVAVSAIPIASASLVVAAIAGFLGSLIDSVLGDTVQARLWSEDYGENEHVGGLIKGWFWLRNNEVNFLMTLFAATLGYAVQAV